VQDRASEDCDMSRPGRNDPCPCGSGKKYKHCCLPGETRGKVTTTGQSHELRQTMQSAVALHQAGKLAQAEALYRRILQQAPREPDALHMLGILAYQVGNYPAALELISSAIAARNTDPGYYVNLGLTHAALQHTKEAETCYRKALAMDPNIAEANSNLGGIMANQMMLDEAVTLCQRALKVNPDLAEAWSNLGLAYNYLDQLDLAVDSLNKALQRMPDCAQAYRNLGIVYGRQGKPDQAIACLNKALALKPDYIAVHDSLFFAYLYGTSVSSAEMIEAHRHYAALLEGPLKPGWIAHTNDRKPDRRLKVGYVSPDFRYHSVAFFIEPLFAHHDRSTFEVFAYYNHGKDDEITARIRALTDHWVACKNLSDQELAERIRADGIDILIDLAGHSANNRLPVFARKPAPVQVTYLGWPATTGLSAMDYRFTTTEVDPPGSDTNYSEQLWSLPRTLWCYRPSPDTPLAERNTQPDTATKDSICFGSINNFTKISPETITLWGRLLHELPASHLLLTRVPEGSARQLLLDRFMMQGIGPDRLRLHGWLSQTELYAMSNAIDIALDPFPYNGTTTTCELLWMGIPVVALIGETSVSRSGFALLSSVGLEALCAHNQDEYVKIALELAGDPARLADLRAGMRTRMADSPLRDEAGFAHDIEEAYRSMWIRWCETVN
jgi:protein O-GlcNAc transferase